MANGEFPAIGGILFDMDGTLVESENLHIGAWMQLLEKHGCDLPEADWMDQFVGTPDSHTRDEILLRFPALGTAGDILEIKQVIFRDMVAEHGEAMAMPGVAIRLQQLAAIGVPMAVGTNGVLVNCRVVLQAAGLAQFFQTFVTFDQVEHGKPAPDIYLVAAERLELRPEQCVVVEDSPTGIHSGLAAGCRVLAIETTMGADRLREAGAHFVFDTASSAMDWIAERLTAEKK